MPAPLHEDALAYLRNTGKPFDAPEINAVMDYLRNNPDQRPSYASDYGGASTMDKMAMGLGMSPEELGVGTQYPMSPTYNEAGYSNQEVSRRNDAPGDLAPYGAVPQARQMPQVGAGPIKPPVSSPQGPSRTITIKEVGPQGPVGVNSPVPTGPTHTPHPSPSRPTTAQPNIPSQTQPNAEIPVTPPFGAPSTSSASPPDGSSGGTPNVTPDQLSSVLPDANASTYGLPDPQGDNSNLWMTLLPLLAGGAFALGGRRPPTGSPHIPPSGVGAARAAGALSGEVIPPGRSVVPSGVGPGIGQTLEGTAGGAMTAQPQLSPTAALPGPRAAVSPVGSATSVPPDVINMPPAAMKSLPPPSKTTPKRGSLLQEFETGQSPAPKKTSSKSTKSQGNKTPPKKRQAGKKKTQSK